MDFGVDPPPPFGKSPYFEFFFFVKASLKLSYELGKITFSTGKPKLTPGEVSTFQGF